MDERETVFHKSSRPPDARRRRGRTSGGPTSIIVSSIAAWKLVAIPKIRVWQSLVVNGNRVAPNARIVTNIRDGPLAISRHVSARPNIDESQTQKGTEGNEKRGRKEFYRGDLCLDSVTCDGTSSRDRVFTGRSKGAEKYIERFFQRVRNLGTRAPTSRSCGSVSRSSPTPRRDSLVTVLNSFRPLFFLPFFLLRRIKTCDVTERVC